MVLSDMYTKEQKEIYLSCVVVMGVVAVVGLVGNSLIIRAWVKYRRIRNDFYTVFVALCIADMIFLVVSVPSSVFDIFTNLQLTTTFVCKASHYVVSACGFVEAYLLVALATLRAILLTNRNTIPRPRAKHLVIVSLACYVVAFLISIPIIGIYNSDQGFCYFDYGLDAVKIAWLLNSFSFILPLFLIVLLYLITYILGQRFVSHSYSPREKRKSRLVGVVILAFILCQLPYRVTHFVEVYNLQDIDGIMLDNIQNALKCLFLVDKAIRPILCSKLTSDLGRTFDEVINCHDCLKSREQQRLDVIHPNPDDDPPGSVPPEPELDLDPDQLTATPGEIHDEDGDSGLGRSLSTSSSASANSHQPLMRDKAPKEEIEME